MDMLDIIERIGQLHIMGVQCRYDANCGKMSDSEWLDSFLDEIDKFWEEIQNEV